MADPYRTVKKNYTAILRDFDSIERRLNIMGSVYHDNDCKPQCEALIPFIQTVEDLKETWKEFANLM